MKDVLATTTVQTLNVSTLIINEESFLTATTNNIMMFVVFQGFKHTNILSGKLLLYY